ncbi:MAG: potassium channel family protein [Promethearchaeota archaeon]
MEIEHKPFHEALYWATDTLTNTGTGLAALNTNAAWYLTTFLMWVGLGVTLFFIEFVYTHLLQKERKMLKVQNHILLIGWNQKIRHFLQNLEGLGADHNYVCIANVDDRPYDLPEIVMLVHGNPEEERILKKAGIEQAQQAIIAVEDDSMAILIALTAQSLNPKLKLTININFSENIKHLKRIKVEQIVCDEELAGDHLLESFYSNLEENKKK